MKVLVVSQYYRPEDAFVPNGVAEGLAARGHQVRVLTSYPNYPHGVVYQGYRQSWRQRDRINGLEVCRVPMVVDHSLSPVKRALNYLSFGASSATARRFAAGADVVYVYATQMTAATGPWLWSAFGGAPYVLHVQDLWPDSVIGSSMVSSGRGKRLVDAALEPWLGSVYRRSAGVLAIAPGMRRILADRGVAEDKLHVVPNWARGVHGAVAPAAGGGGPARSGCTVLYAGNVGDMQDLETAVRAAHRLQGTGLVLRIVGTGAALPRVQALSESLGTTNVEFLGRVPSTEMGPIQAAADYSLVTLKDLPAFRGTVPSKFQSSLAAGLPVITTVLGDVSDLTLRHGVGFTAEPEDVDSLERAFRQALGQDDLTRRDMARRAVTVYETTFSYESALSAIEAVLVGADRHSKGNVRV